MKALIWTVIVVGMLVAETAAVHAQQAPPDIILSNGKIITVDDKFSIAQAVAVRGDRIVAVGTNQEITRLAGPSTRRIDLRGRSVTPGFIDHHGHYMREGNTWLEETRWEGIETRKQALDMLRAKAAAVGPDVWLFNLMGWSMDQFSDDKRPFTRAELDAVAPNNPVAVQEAYYHTYVNSKALQALGITDQLPDPASMPAGSVARDAAGRATGVFDEAGVRAIDSRLLGMPRDAAKLQAGHVAMIADMNRAGLTAIGSSCPDDTLAMYRQLRRDGRLNVRLFCQGGVPAGNTKESVDKALPQIAQLKFFQGDSYLNEIAYGEGVYGPASDNMLHVKSSQRPEDFAQFGRIAREIAKAGLPMHVHTTLEGTFDGFLDQIEQINKEYPIRTLRWATFHSDQVTAAHLERMKKLGMYIGIHMRPPTIGGIFLKIRGDRGYDQPALQLVQNSGIMWGVGTDFNLGPYNPFISLRYLVTGKMVGGLVVNRQPISREDALIAYTRRNAFFIFEENNLGSIQPGKMADLVVLDRDYLTIPADQIKDIKPVLTMMGGRVVYDAAAATSSAAR